MQSSVPLILIVGLALSSAAPPAASETLFTFASGACKSALPVFDGNVRSRPLAVQNEGAAPAFVTCAQQGALGVLPTFGGVYLLNNSAADAQVNCTLVVSTVNSQYYPESVTVSANSVATIFWAPPDPTDTFTSPNMAYSCNLPPGTGISRIETDR